jgi:hypothetical protein
MHHPAVRFFVTFFVVSSLLGAPLFSVAQSASETFFVNSEYDLSGRTQVAATLRHVSLRAYFYVEDSFYSTLTPTERNALNTRLLFLGNEFDNTMYGRLRQAYGAEQVPGIDGDARVTILLTQLNGTAGGYIDIGNELPRSQNSRSNEREMMYISTAGAFTNDARDWIAHEFVHLITYYQKDILRGATEEVWLSEALAEYAPTLLGYNEPFEDSYLERRTNDFLNLPTDSLTEWQGNVFDAASANLFIHYLVGRWGEGILRALLTNSSHGIGSVNEAVKKLGGSETFPEVFADWATTNYINGPTNESATRYEYQSFPVQNFHVSPLITSSVFATTANSFTIAVKPWEQRWYRFVPGELGSASNSVLKIEFSAPNPGPFSDFRVPYLVNSISGTWSVKSIAVQGGAGVAYIPAFGTQALSVVVVPLNASVEAAAQHTYPFTPFTLTTSLVDKAPSVVSLYPDGALLRARGDTRVYVIKTVSGDESHAYKRWIQSPEIFNGYGHLHWSDIIEVEPEVLAAYEESSLIRFAKDPRVYEVKGSGEKQWLNITAAQFEASGRRWDAVYEINEKEWRWYRTGSDIKG